MSLLALMPVDVYDIMAGATRDKAIAELLACAQGSGRESWAEFNGTLLIANSDDAPEDIESRWSRERRRSRP